MLMASIDRNILFITYLIENLMFNCVILKHCQCLAYIYICNKAPICPFVETDNQRYKKWWNWGTRFPESKLACKKYFGEEVKILCSICNYYLSADNDVNINGDCGI
jgi:hypothetical protein